MSEPEQHTIFLKIPDYFTEEMHVELMNSLENTTLPDNYTIISLPERVEFFDEESLDNFVNRLSKLTNDTDQ